MFFKATLEHEMELRAKADMKRIQSEMTAKAKIERENQDLYLEQIRVKAKENRSTVMESIQGRWKKFWKWSTSSVKSSVELKNYTEIAEIINTRP